MQYDPQALASSAKRRQKNIQAFKETIRKEKADIDHFLYIISQIDPDHPDVKKIISTIKKKKENIRIFKLAIRNEEMLIKQELRLAKENSNS